MFLRLDLDHSRGLVIGDFNNDSNFDPAVANFDSDTVSILLGNGVRTFGNSTAFAAVDRPNDIKVGDLKR